MNSSSRNVKTVNVTVVTLALLFLLTSVSAQSAEVDEVKAAEAKAAEAKAAEANAEAAKAAAANAPAPVNASVNYYGDKLDWPYAIPARKRLNADDKICIPANTTVIGESSTFESDSDNKKWLRVRVRGNPKSLKDKADELKNAPDCTNSELLVPYQLFFVSADNAASASRFGFDFGALIVPFKLQLSGKHQLTPSATVGSYVGYRFKFDEDWISGITLTPIAFGGGSPIAVTKSANGTESTEVLAGLSAGFGLITTLKDSFQIGIVTGIDHVTSNTKYDYNNKWWISAEIGFSFLF